MPRQKDDSKELTPREKASIKYDESVEHIRLRVPKGWKEIIQKHVDNLPYLAVKGKAHNSVQAYIQDLIRRDIEDLRNQERTLYDLALIYHLNYYSLNEDDYQYLNQEFRSTCERIQAEGDFLIHFPKYRSKVDYPDSYFQCNKPEPPKKHTRKKNTQKAFTDYSGVAEPPNPMK